MEYINISKNYWSFIKSSFDNRQTKPLFKRCVNNCFTILIKSYQFTI